MGIRYGTAFLSDSVETRGIVASKAESLVAVGMDMSMDGDRTGTPGTSAKPWRRASDVAADVESNVLVGILPARPYKTSAAQSREWADDGDFNSLAARSTAFGMNE